MNAPAPAHPSSRAPAVQPPGRVVRPPATRASVHGLRACTPGCAQRSSRRAAATQAGQPAGSTIPARKWQQARMRPRPACVPSRPARVAASRRECAAPVRGNCELQAGAGGGVKGSSCACFAACFATIRASAAALMHPWQPRIAYRVMRRLAGHTWWPSSFFCAWPKCCSQETRPRRSSRLALVAYGDHNHAASTSRS